ncbi:MAG: Holliday junction branch migration protein RuvA [Planctomycetia bacterium]|nr:Holliday junction branch migration protein RuvA [Planctomycetia bacterium]
MISGITGKLTAVFEEYIILQAGFFDFEVMIPEYTRRKVQMQVGNEVSFFTIFYLDGNPAQGRLNPKLIGFQSEFEREFFELFCSVDGVGSKKALRAMVHPVEEVAHAIKEQDAKFLATLPGVGPATAERIIAKLRRKVTKFALLAPSDGETPISATPVEAGIFADAFQALLALGHSETEARKKIEKLTRSGQEFRTVQEVISAVYAR